ncbi:cytochrome b-c1 complex subunit 8-like [Acomys russatus]|uniref:cytochrome b-c1 complex subunit 8-like n=1 Tax=Acomys russatus TaxID=60746 RepID=UPI0021E267F4|nr:cytochrome b-c1 complex subunit 8-like [Acomys russatus]
MGCQFGDLTRMQHAISYSLSLFSKGIPNVLCLTHECILHRAPPFVVFYLIYTRWSQKFEQSKRKNPAVYANGE